MQSLEFYAFFNTCKALKASMISITLLLLYVSFTGASSNGEDIENKKHLDKQGYDAIVQLHKSMDDDLSGGIDPTESSDFLREELRLKDKDPLTRRHQTFHRDNDESITVDDLWARWTASNERKWTVDEVRDWLVRSVELPQYVDTFKKAAVDGATLPRLAVQNTNYMQAVFGITNPVHRQKLQLKAMDVVLFGHRGAKPSYGKDILLVTLMVVAVGAYWFAIHQRKASQKHALALNAQLGKLKDMEQEFVILQNKLEEEKCRQTSCKGSVEDEEIENKEELETLKLQLLEAERWKEQRSPLLQSLLRKTYELEVARINHQKLESFKEMNEAREMVEKLRKKQSSLLNQIRSVHGTETEIDERILIVRQKMEKTARSIEECERRWSEIETLVGFNILNYPTSVLPQGQLSSIASAAYSRQRFYIPGTMELDNDVSGYSISDNGTHGGQTAEGALLGAYMHHNRQPMVARANQCSLSPILPTHTDASGPLHRATYSVASSDMLRSVSTSDLAGGQNGSSVWDVVSSANELVHSSSATAASRVLRTQRKTLGQIGKKGSEVSMGATSDGGKPAKAKKKIFSIFSDNRDKRE